MRKREGFIVEGVNTFVHIAMFADLRRNVNKNVQRTAYSSSPQVYAETTYSSGKVNKRVRGAVRNPRLFDVMTIILRNKMLIITTGVQMSLLWCSRCYERA